VHRSDAVKDCGDQVIGEHIESRVEGGLKFVLIELIDELMALFAWGHWRA